MSSAGAIRAGRAFVELFADDSKLARGLKGAKRQLQTFSRFSKTVGTGLFGGAAALSAPFIAATKVFASFSDQMLEAKAVSSATAEEFAAMESEAKMLGRTTSFTASAVAGAMANLGRSGFKPKAIIDSTGHMLNLARATSTELPLAAEIGAAAMSQFEIGVEQTERVVNTLSRTANGSAQRLEDFGEALKPVGPQAFEAGESLEDVSASIGLLANNFIKGSLAGNALVRAYKNIATTRIQKKLQSVGVHAVDSEGNLRKMHEILRDLGNATRDFPSAKKLAMFEEIFGRGSTAALKLSKTGANFEEMADKIKNSGPTAAAVAEEMDSGIGGSLRRLGSAIEGIANAVGESIAPVLESWSERLQGLSGWITKVVEDNGEFVAGIVKTIAVVGGVGAALVSAGILASALASVIGLATTAFGIFGGAVSIVTGLFAALASPIGIVIGLGATLIGFFVDWGGTMKSVTSSAGKQFEGFKERALNAWGGIRDAIAAGDLSLAFKIVTLALKAEWFRIVGAIKSKWNEWIGFFQSIWTNAVFGAARIMTNGWAGLQSFFWNLTDTLADAWSSFTSFMRKTWNSTIGFISKAWDKLKSTVTGKRSRSAQIDRETKQANEEIDQERDAAIMRRERERKSALKGIEDERKGTIDALNEELQRREQSRMDAEAAENAENDRRLNEAKAELAEAIEKAKGKRKKADKEAEKKEGENAEKAAEATGDEIAKKLTGSRAGLGDILAGKGSVSGTRTGFDRFGFGRSSEADQQKKILEELKEIKKATKKTASEGERTVPLL